MAETGGGGPVGVLVRILCVAGGAIVGAFLLAVLAPGAATAHADSSSEPAPAAVVAEQPSDDDAFWAQPDSVSSAASRRAAVVADNAEPGHWVRTSHRADDASSAPSAAGQRGPVGAATSIPIGTLGAGGGATDGGPAISQLAVLSCALAAVLWLSQRLRHGEVWARSAFVSLSIERPG